MPLVAKGVLQIAALVVGAILCALLFRNTVVQGQDFDVFWNAARAVLSGRDPYDINRFGAMVYKYPPWSLVFFLPLGFLDLSVAKILWALIELGSLGGVGYWLYSRAQVTLQVIFFTAISFYGIWAVHFLDGQISLMVLAASLFLLSSPSAVRQAGAGYFLSFKVFPVLALFSVFEKRKTLAWLSAATAIFVLCSVVLFFYLRMDFQSTVRLFPNWIAAADSGDVLFGLQKTLGRENQGLPVFWIKLFGFSKGAAIFASVVLVGLFARLFAKKAELSTTEKSTLFLAWTAVIHPLAWFHSFVFAFPLVCVVWQKLLIKPKKPRLFSATIFSLLLVAFTQKTMGDCGLWLENHSIKSWAILGMSFLLYLQCAKRRTN